jgi:hypothetical protein
LKAARRVGARGVASARVRIANVTLVNVITIALQPATGVAKLACAGEGPLGVVACSERIAGVVEDALVDIYKETSNGELDIRPAPGKESSFTGVNECSFGQP